MAEPLRATIQKTIELASRCAQAETSDNYGALADQVEELEGKAREAVQSQEQNPLTPHENPNPDVILSGRSPRRISRVQRKLSARSPRHRSEEVRVAQCFQRCDNRPRMNKRF